MHQPTDASTPPGSGDRLASTQARAEELTFLQRLVATFAAKGSAALNRATSDPEAHPQQSFDADLARMQSPVFKRLAQQLAASVPEDATFGTFRGPR